MAAEIQCIIVDDESGKQCERFFVPGQGGARGKCWMHLQREYRNSARSNSIASIHGVGPRQQLSVRLPEAVFQKVSKFSSEDGVHESEWVRVAVEKALEQKLTLKLTFRRGENEAKRDHQVCSRLDKESIEKVARIVKASRIVKRDGGSIHNWLVCAVEHEVQVRIRKQQRSKKPRRRAA